VLADDLDAEAAGAPEDSGEADLQEAQARVDGELRSDDRRRQDQPIR
jgi:hypothetical protein